jgi:hypothetical protein
MHQNFTPSKNITSEKKESLNDFQPEKSVLQNILNYSKSVEVKTTEKKKHLFITLN